MKCDWNWLKTGKKKNSVFWRGVYSCIDCKKSYKIWIDSIQHGSKVIFNINYDSEDHHLEIISPKIHCKGEERKTMMIELMAKGTSHVHNENVIYNNSAQNLSESIIDQINL